MITRAEIRQYAISVCLPEIEKWANAYENGDIPTVADGTGYSATMLEGILRPFWGLAPIINEEELYITVSGKRTELCRFAADFISSAVNPASPRYLGRHESGHRMYFQCLTELAGLLVCMFFAREKMWDPIPDENKQMIADFILDGCASESDCPAENNHLWFPVLCMTVMKKFGFTRDRCDGDIRAALAKLEGMYVGNGWYSDGPRGRYDYYCAWSMHAYPLLWSIIEDDTFDGYRELRHKYLSRTERFLKDYISFFDKDGAAVPFGRSLSYRFAETCVFPLAVMAGCDVSPALAKTVTAANITYFADNMITKDKCLPTGYLYDAPALIESYTSGGGSYWCAKTFLCLMMDDAHPFWASSPVPLPQNELRPEAKGLDIALCPSDNSGVTLYNNSISYYQGNRYCNPFLDMAGFYCKFAYNSVSGFAVSSHDNVSADSMISLTTPDESMHSHRYGFVSLPSRDGVMISEHLPFANDRNTIIRTYMLPLGGPMHLRAHIVTLSQPYKITEGGFSVPLTDDARKKQNDDGAFSIAAGSITSSLRTASTVFFSYGERRSQPGMHILAPLSVYPCWYTNVLEPGRYIFASVFSVTKSGHAELPTPVIDGNTVIIGERQIKLE